MAQRALQQLAKRENHRRRDFGQCEIYLSRPFLYIVHCLKLQQTFLDDTVRVDTKDFVHVLTPENAATISDAITLTIISACIQPRFKQCYTTTNRSSGILVCGLHNQLGIIGSYGTELAEITTKFVRHLVSTNIDSYRVDYMPVKLIQHFADAALNCGYGVEMFWEQPNVPYLNTIGLYTGMHLYLIT